MTSKAPLGAARTSTQEPFRRDGGGSVVERAYTAFSGDMSQVIKYLQAQGGGDEAITLPFAQSWMIYACAMVRARAWAQTKLQLWRNRQDDAAEVTSSPVFEVLRKPYPGISERHLWMLTSLYLDLDGEVLWLLSKLNPQLNRYEPVGRGEMPEEILCIPGTRASPYVDANTSRIVSWSYGVGNAAMTWPAESVWHLRLPDPYSPLRGFGPAQAAMRLAAKEFSAERFDEALAQNYGLPSLVFSTDANLTDKQAQQANQSISTRLSSSNAGKPLLLANGVRPENVAFSPTDMAHQQVREWGLNGIMAIFGVTRPLLGLTEGLNYASAHEAKKVFWEDTMAPHLEYVAGEFEDGFLGRLRGAESGYGASWDLSRVPALRADLGAKVEIVSKLCALGVTFNKAAELAEWEINPLTDEDFDEPEPLDLGGALPGVPPGAPAQQDEPEPPQGSERAIHAAERRGLESEPERRAYQRKFDERLQSADAKVAKRSGRVLEDYVLAVRRRLKDIAEGKEPVVHMSAAPSWRTKAPPPDIDPLLLAAIQAQLPRIEGFVDDFTSKVLPVVEQVYLAAAADLAAELSLASVSIGPGSAELAAFVATKRVKLAEGVLSRLADAVTETIARVLLAPGPLDPSGLGLAIQSTLEDLNSELRILQDRIPERAQRIARTEVTSAANSARFSEARVAGIDQMMWVAAADDATRESHAKLDGLIRPTGEEYAQNLRFPGDPAAPAEEVVNCRCALAPYIPEAAE